MTGDDRGAEQSLDGSGAPEMSADSIEFALGELVKRAELLLDGPIPAIEVEENEAAGGRCELIEGPSLVTLILDMPGYVREDVEVRAYHDEVEVSSQDFKIKARLPCSVNPSSAKSKCRNGILSITLQKVL